LHDMPGSACWKPGKVIHDGVAATEAVGSLPAMGKDDVAMAQVFGVGRFHTEALDENAVDAVLLHPLKVPENGFAVVRAEYFCHPAVRVAEGRGVFLVIVEFAHVRPEVNVAESGFEPTFGGVVTPSSAGAVSWSRKPALVAADHMAGQRG